MFSSYSKQFFCFIFSIWDKIQLQPTVPDFSWFILSHTSRDFDMLTFKNYDEKTEYKCLHLKFNMFSVQQTLKH